MLRDEIRPLTGNRRRFFLLRIVDMDKKTALNLCNIKNGTYNTWCQDSEFVALYRRRDEFSADFKQEAIQLLRRDNQLAAVMLETKIVAKMQEEVDSGIYELMRTNIAKSVYERLIADLDVVPKVQSLTWQDKVIQITTTETPAITEGEIVEESDGSSNED